MKIKNFIKKYNLEINFLFRIKRFDKTSYLSINELEKELCLVYDKRVMIENLKRQKAQEKIRQQKEIERRKAEKLQEKKIRKKEKRILVFKKHCKKGLWLIIILLILIFFLCIYKEYKKYVPLCFDAKEIKGMQYAEVSDNLIDKGFNNISYNPIADLEIESMEKENEISKIIVNNISDFDRNSKFHVDSKIIIEYHTLKEIPIGMSPNEIIGQDYNKITKKLKEKGFVNIECTPLDDLIVGWLHDENEIESIKIDGVEEFMSNNVFRLDAKFDIEYHSFD